MTALGRYKSEEAGHPSRDNFDQSDSALGMLMTDCENIPKARILAVIYFWFSFVSAQQIELESITVGCCEDILS